ncbi:hypothetical protein EMWEY_00010950 [Eimeria maxima]|uniref:SUEL-type lectin domain-containing protein n=1 Tax=Eimeria maxima TaxID=5804 RepID=U6M3P6_EIMMA|nr:hypothetical protein EMWEY_00010950 [Eimeria maxima]CDJ57693.1 hypothetical protein EMWEY_00010950 [Eimeria maxima]
MNCLFVLHFLLLLRLPVLQAKSTAGSVQGVFGTWKEKLMLQCTSGYGLHIIDSSFGNPLLAGNTIFKSNRDAPHTKLVIQQQCENRNTCQVLVDPATFGILKSFGTTEPTLAVTFACLPSGPKGVLRQGK